MQTLRAAASDTHSTSPEHHLNKKNLSESDICDKFIRPAMEQAGWNPMDQIYREYLSVVC